MTAVDIDREVRRLRDDAAPEGKATRLKHQTACCSCGRSIDLGAKTDPGFFYYCTSCFPGGSRLRRTPSLWGDGSMEYAVQSRFVDEHHGSGHWVFEAWSRWDLEGLRYEVDRLNARAWSRKEYRIVCRPAEEWQPLDTEPSDSSMARYES